jgi:hypothetical protein
MSISEQLKKLRDGLATWARANGGTVAIVSRPSSLLKCLGLKPKGVRVVLMFDSESKRGDFEETGRVDRKFKAFISVPEGLKASKSDALVEDDGFYDLAEQVREILRGLEVESAEDIDEIVTDYLAMNRFELDGTYTDDLQIDFQIATQLPVPLLEDAVA